MSSAAILPGHSHFKFCGFLLQLICLVLNRVTAKNGMYSNVVSMYVTGNLKLMSAVGKPF